MRKRHGTAKRDEPVGPWRAHHLALYFGKLDLHVLFRLINAIADAGFNMLCLNPGRAMRFDRHPELAEPESLSANQLRGIVSYARGQKLEVVPVLNLMSHGSEILHAYPQFRSRCEDVYHPQRRGLYPLLYDLIDETIDIFQQPRWLHIGHDEIINSYDIRKRRSVWGTGDAAGLFADDICRLRAHLASRSVGTMMWADMLLDPRQFSDACFGQSGCYGSLPDDMAKAIRRSSDPRSIPLHTDMQ